MTLNRHLQPELKEISKVRLPDFANVKLDNEIPVHLLNVGSQDLVRLQFSIPAGSIYQKQSLLAYFTNKMLKEGSSKYSAAQIAEKMDFYGAYFDVHSGRDYAYFTLFCLNKYLDPILEIIADILAHPLWPEKELQIIIQQEKQAFQIRNTKPKTISFRKFHQELFGEKHPYGSMASLSDYDQIKKEDLQAFFEVYYQPKNWHIFVSGKTSLATFDILNRHLGRLSSASVHLPESEVPKIGNKTADYFVERKDALQTALKMGELSISRKHEDYPIFSLAQTILGGFFGSRLMQNIREDKGYTYGIHSGIHHFKKASVFLISSEVGAKYADKALSEVKNELLRLRQEEVPESELQLVKNYMAGSLLKSLNGPFALGDMMRMLHENNLSKDYFTNYISAIQEASAKDIERIANKYLHEKDMISVLVGSKITEER